ncbi:MAG: hypothetical protein LBN33_02555 [Desulfovibrio sp.]|jgi:hypothetical protein|nr:hypothetical protein [Desulfovibrio sp.]
MTELGRTRIDRKGVSPAPTSTIYEVVAMRFFEGKQEIWTREFTTDQAAEFLGVSVGTFLRKGTHFAEEGD